LVRRETKTWHAEFSTNVSPITSNGRVDDIISECAFNRYGGLNSFQVK
jgi:hypothetical protein